MDLLDRYIAAIARDLPKRQAGDISAELRDTLLSDIEEREQGLGRPLTRKELEVLLREFGHPLVLAARYRKTQYLIGPQVFPFWWATLRIVFAVVGAVWLAGLIIAVATAHAPAAVALNRMASSFWPIVLTLFGSVTLVFAGIERADPSRLGLKWSPRQLPPVRLKGRRRFNVAVESAMGAMFLLWWTGVIHFHDYISAPTPIRVEFAPIWIQMYWPILLYVAGELVLNLMELARPNWARTNALASLIKNIAGCVILYYVVRAGHWLVVTAAALPLDAAAKMQAGFDVGMKLGLLATAFILGGKAVYDIWRFFRAVGRPGPLAVSSGRPA